MTKLDLIKEIESRMAISEQLKKDITDINDPINAYHDGILSAYEHILDFIKENN